MIFETLSQRFLTTKFSKIQTVKTIVIQKNRRNLWMLSRRRNLQLYGGIFWIFQKTWKVNILFWKSKIWDDYFEEFSVGFVIVFSIFFCRHFFMEKFAKQNVPFSSFLKNPKNAPIELQISPPWKHPRLSSLSQSSLYVWEDQFGTPSFNPGQNDDL